MNVRHAVILVLGVVLLALVLCGDVARAQSRPSAGTPPVLPELRLDVLTAEPASVQLGAGGVVTLGHYVRLSLLGAAGPAREGGAAARGEVIARFTLDPFRQSRWGVALGGGVSVRHEPVLGTRPVLALTLDVDPPGVRTWQPSVQVGLAGGFRAGLGLRRTRAMRR